MFGTTDTVDSSCGLKACKLCNNVMEMSHDHYYYILAVPADSVSRSPQRWT